MSFVCEGVTHCMKCAKVLKMDEIGMCKECEKTHNLIELKSKLKKLEVELEKYKNVTYFEKLEDGNLYKIDKERADDLYEHGNGCWLYVQMWKRKEV